MRRIQMVELTLRIVIATLAMGGLVQLLQPQASAGHNGQPARTESSATVSRAAAVTAGSCALSLVRSRRIRVVGGVHDLAAGYGAVWALAHETVSKLDPTTGLVTARIRISGDSTYGQIATGAGSVWVTSSDRAGSVIDRIDPHTDRVIATLHRPGALTGIAVGSHRVWVAQPRQGAGRLIVINPRTDRDAGHPIEVGPGPGEVMYALRRIWVQNTSPPSITRVNIHRSHATTVVESTTPTSSAPAPVAIAAGDHALWSLGNGSLNLIDRAGLTDLGALFPRGVAVAFGDHSVWVLSYPRSRSPALFEPIPATATLSQINPHNGRPKARPVALGMLQPIAIVFIHHAVWIADYHTSTVTRIDIGCRRKRPSQAITTKR